jgi:hypothetical protein
VPLRDTRALRDWALSKRPSDDLWQQVHLWLVGLDQAPWQAPSYPVESRSDRPNYEVRRARIDRTSVLVEYLHVYNGGFVDLLSLLDSPDS